ncbi:unnamed protein product [Leptidea sinapis]|uniref:Lipase n=1 Tax=Leptidea sinapis TaxID=189913 RepID=A0A5E4QVQ8_9NEOP|nr:unnamed protein product [Leptidea sinapis]
MASKGSVTFNILAATAALVVANVIRMRVLPIDFKSKNVLEYPNESLYNFTELANRYGYHSEEHTVVTEDGYILNVFRINSGNCDGRMKGPPVVLMHGLLLSSDAWLDAGPEAGLAYLLADSCYDLWVGNQRGNYYARRHLTLNPDKDPSFWDFSIDEIGFYDIPATIDYVLRNTGFGKLNYIGYSQGAGTFFVMCSERPGYCNKVNVVIGLAPAARQTHTKSMAYRLLATGISALEDPLSQSGFREIFSKTSPLQEIAKFICQVRFLSEPLCGNFISGFFDSYHPGSITNRTLGMMFSHFPAGTSLHTMARYGQSMQTDQFQKFDYGAARNMKKYGCKEPPKYNLSSVTPPMVILYGRNDHLVDTKDVYWLVNELPNVLEVEEVADPLWNHFDVAYSQYVNQRIFPTVYKYLEHFSTT